MCPKYRLGLALTPGLETATVEIYSNCFPMEMGLHGGLFHQKDISLNYWNPHLYISILKATHFHDVSIVIIIIITSSESILMNLLRWQRRQFSGFRCHYSHDHQTHHHHHNHSHDPQIPLLRWWPLCLMNHRWWYRDGDAEKALKISIYHRELSW